MSAIERTLTFGQRAVSKGIESVIISSVIFEFMILSTAFPESTP